MGRGYFNEKERELLLKNPFVSDVDEKRIIYANEFKRYFIEKYLAGEKPTAIFRSAGFDIGVLGDKRIESASARWRQLYEAGGMKAFEEGEMEPEHKIREHEMRRIIEDNTKEMESYRMLIRDQNEKIARLEKVITDLYMENTELKSRRKKHTEPEYQFA